MFYLIFGIIAAVFSLLSVIFSGVLRVVLAAAGMICVAYWCVYFSSIRYELSEKYITAESGIFIKKTRKTALSDVILEKHISVGEIVFITILRTSGSSTVIFGRI